jgi:hypothetical protein
MKAMLFALRFNELFGGLVSAKVQVENGEAHH